MQRGIYTYVSKIERVAMQALGTIQFGTVDIQILANSMHATVAELKFRAGEKASTHQHPHEASNDVVQGEFDCLSGGVVVRLRPGDAISVAPNSAHNVHCVNGSDGVIVTFWTPSRMDLIAKLQDAS